MSSPCRNLSGIVIALLGAGLVLAACDEKKSETSSLPVSQHGPGFVAVSSLVPGGGPLPPPVPQTAQYENNPHAISDGKRLFDWYNCSGCHFHGAGGIGPALMDNQWRYGGRLDQIYASIYQGRPNGMPVWGGKIPDAQIWEIAAYVRSLPGPNPAPSTQGETTAPPIPGIPQPPEPGAPSGSSSP